MTFPLVCTWCFSSFKDIHFTTAWLLLPSLVMLLRHQRVHQSLCSSASIRAAPTLYSPVKGLLWLIGSLTLSAQAKKPDTSSRQKQGRTNLDEVVYISAPPVAGESQWGCWYMMFIKMMTSSVTLTGSERQGSKVKPGWQRMQKSSVSGCGSNQRKSLFRDYCTANFSKTHLVMNARQKSVNHLLVSWLARKGNNSDRPSLFYWHHLKLWSESVELLSTTITKPLLLSNHWGRSDVPAQTIK